jgi:hypothetical protein
MKAYTYSEARGLADPLSFQCCNDCMVYVGSVNRT